MGMNAAFSESFKSIFSRELVTEKKWDEYNIADKSHM